MGTTPLRRFLQSLCNNSCWNYAVFWKLQQQNQTFLMWEDGYFDTMKVQDSMEDLFAGGRFGGLEESSSCSAYNGDGVELAVAYMSTFQYALGDGVVGDVAYTGNCRWVFAGMGEFNTASVPEHADEWLIQFAAGVKTILLVPVTPHGVLQLGSLETLPEDTQLANFIKNDFFMQQDFMGYSYSNSFATNQQFPSESQSSFMMQSFPSDDFNWSNHNGPIISDAGPLLTFPKECELHKALGPAFMESNDDSFGHLSIGDNIPSGQIYSKTNGMLFYNENLGNMNLSGESSLICLTKRKNMNENGGFDFEGESSVFSNHAPEFFGRVKNHNNHSSSSPSAISYEGVVDVITEEKEEQKNKGSKPSKRKGKGGAKQKARPRDRQLIQDRLKDLRELVPDGAKCSIDGLLDKTVKHMLFLESVGDRANKLKQYVQSEGVGSIEMNDRRPEEKSGENGASWAVELGGDCLKACPIIVEDLQYPGHMIIKMICDDSSRFLEIAEVIHGLNLTIINGVTERRSDNTWARYIVEVPRGFHRLDIFWPLMKLLQQQQHKPISSKI